MMSRSLLATLTRDTSTPDERRQFVAEALAKQETGARACRERDYPLIRGFK